MCLLILLKRQVVLLCVFREVIGMGMNRGNVHWRRGPRNGVQITIRWQCERRQSPQRGRGTSRRVKAGEGGRRQATAARAVSRPARAGRARWARGVTSHNLPRPLIERFSWNALSPRRRAEPDTAACRPTPTTHYNKNKFDPKIISHCSRLYEYISTFFVSYYSYNKMSNK